MKVRRNTAEAEPTRKQTPIRAEMYVGVFLFICYRKKEYGLNRKRTKFNP